MTHIGTFTFAWISNLSDVPQATCITVFNTSKKLRLVSFSELFLAQRRTDGTLVTGSLDMHDPSPQSEHKPNSDVIPDAQSDHQELLTICQCFYWIMRDAINSRGQIGASYTGSSIKGLRKTANPHILQPVLCHTPQTFIYKSRDQQLRLF